MVSEFFFLLFWSVCQCRYMLARYKQWNSLSTRTMKHKATYNHADFCVKQKEFSTHGSWRTNAQSVACETYSYICLLFFGRFSLLRLLVRLTFGLDLLGARCASVSAVSTNIKTNRHSAHEWTKNWIPALFVCTVVVAMKYRSKG